MTRIVAPAILAAVLGAACSHAWDDYDPRLGGGGAAQSGTGAGTPTSSAETGTASGEPSSTSTSSGAGGGNGGGPDVTSGGGSTSESSSSGTPTETLEIVAIVADCTDTQDPDPDDCDDASASNAFSINADASPFALEWVGYLRFAPGDELAGRTVDAVSLRMVVSTEARADSEDSGVVWQCEPFDRDALEEGAPAFLGGAPVGASIGPVDLGEVVTFELVGLDVQPGAPVYLAVDATSEDNVEYLDERSVTPPTLIITYH